MTVIRTSSRADRHTKIGDDEPHYPASNGAKLKDRHDTWTARHYYRALRKRDVSAFYARHVVTNLLTTQAEFIGFHELPTPED